MKIEKIRIWHNGSKVSPNKSGIQNLKLKLSFYLPKKLFKSCRKSFTFNSFQFLKCISFSVRQNITFYAKNFKNQIRIRFSFYHCVDVRNWRKYADDARTHSQQHCMKYWDWTRTRIKHWDWNLKRFLSEYLKNVKI